MSIESSRRTMWDEIDGRSYEPVDLKKAIGAGRMPVQAMFLHDPDRILILVKNLMATPVEVNDIIERHTPGGPCRFIVKDPGYRREEGIPTFPECYVIRYVREGEEVSAPNPAVYNFHGANTRLNMGSTDQSINLVVKEQDLADLAEAIHAVTDVQQRERLEGILGRWTS